MLNTSLLNIMFYRMEILLLMKQRGKMNKLVLLFYRELWYVILILQLNNDLLFTSTLSVNTLNLNELNLLGSKSHCLSLVTT